MGGTINIVRIGKAYGDGNGGTFKYFDRWSEKSTGQRKKIVINDEYRCWFIGAGTYIIFCDKNRKSIGFAVFCEESQRWQNVWFFRGIWEEANIHGVSERQNFTNLSKVTSGFSSNHPLWYGWHKDKSDAWGEVIVRWNTSWYEKSGKCECFTF